MPVHKRDSADLHIPHLNAPSSDVVALISPLPANVAKPKMKQRIPMPPPQPPRQIKQNSDIPHLDKRSLRILVSLVVLGILFVLVRAGSSGDPGSAASTPYRIFGPAPSSHNHKQHNQMLMLSKENPKSVSYQEYTNKEQNKYMLKYGKQCHNSLPERYSQLSATHQVEVWKYCMLHLEHGNIYLEQSNIQFFQSITDLAKPDEFVAIETKTDEVGLLHSAFLKIGRLESDVVRNMINLLTVTPLGDLQRDPLLLQRSLHRFVQEDPSKQKWTMWTSRCQDLEDPIIPEPAIRVLEKAQMTLEERLLQLENNPHASPYVSSTLPRTHGIVLSCPIPNGYCCHVVSSQESNHPILALRHPVMPSKIESKPLSLSIFEKSKRNIHENDMNYISTIHETVFPVTPVSQQTTPNFFDILLKNDCLPSSKVCHKCMKSTKAGSCHVCKEACPCYCNVLCKIRPPPKIVSKELHIYPPVYKKDPSRLIPKIINQTWYEEVTEEKYPNMSRLIESWQQSGWEYNFYNDDMAMEFLSAHFPPEVREAYDAIIPGAFKADLFRYCVLLIRGGVYADMDVLLEANLDEAVTPDVGFMTPIDEPGIHVGRRSCLWNGLLAVAPGHVFLAKTIEMVVNNIRNRFTSVDYDDMLCPSPELSVSHTVDTLFTCGPCILGAGINTILGRHMQDEFEIGDVDVFKSSPDGVFENDLRLMIPGRTVILQQNKQDMGAHRFTWVEKSLIVAATDMPDYDDRPPDVEHYSKTHTKVGVYGLDKLYKNNLRANEEIRLIVHSSV